MKKILLILPVCLLLLACSSKPVGAPLESDYYWLDEKLYLNAMAQLKQSALSDMDGKGKGDRNLQKVALERIEEHGIYALPFLISVLEVGSPHQREVAKEALLNLAQGRSEVDYRVGGKSKGPRVVSNKKIIAGRFLLELEKEYKHLPYRSFRSATMVQNKTYPNPIFVRRLYRMQLAELMSKVGSSEHVERLIYAVQDVENDSPVLRSGMYRSIAAIAGEGAIKTLIEVYQEERNEGVRATLCETLQKITGMDYPNHPKLWMVWARKKGLINE